MAVVEALARAQQPLPLAALSAQLRLPKSSLLYLLQALETARYVQRTPDGFALGDATYRLASQIDVTDEFTAVTRHVMRDLLQKTRETVLLGQFGPDRLSGIYIKSLTSPQEVRFTPTVSVTKSLYSTAMGMTLLAFAGEGVLQAYLRTVQLKAFTPHTVTTQRELRKRLTEIRHRGYAVSVEQTMIGGSAVAAPVFDRDGAIIMVLVIAAPTQRLVANVSAWAALLIEGAGHLSGIRAPSDAG